MIDSFIAVASRKKDLVDKNSVIRYIKGKKDIELDPKDKAWADEYEAFLNKKEKEVKKTSKESGKEKGTKKAGPKKKEVKDKDGDKE